MVHRVQTPRTRTAKRRLALAALALALAIAVGAANAAAQSSAELEGTLGELEQNTQRQGDLQAQIDSQNDEINDLIARESELRRRAVAVQAELDRRQAELDQATAELDSERAHLAEVKARLARAVDSLEELLVGIYKSNDPDTLSVVLGAASWEEMVTESEYIERVESYQESVVDRVSTLRGEVELAVERLGSIQQQIRSSRDVVAGRRAELAVAERELGTEHATLVSARRERQTVLEQLRSRESVLEKELGTTVPGPGEQARLVGQTAIAPAGAPLAVKAVIEAANAISDKPYIWGGGHGSFEDDGYDCSGAVSYALHGGGMLDSPMDSTGFTVYGDPGAGNWITTYAYSGHMYAVIAGLRFDTGGPGGGNGPRWSTVMRETSGFIARHPSGF